MNGLSWLLYLSGVSGSVSSTFVVFGVLMIIVVAVVNLVSFFKAVERYDNITNSWHIKDEVKGEIIERFKIPVLVHTRLFLFAVFLIFISNLIPTRDTVLMIAASEIGEATLITPENKATFDRLRAVVDTELEGLINRNVPNQNNE